LLSFYEEQTIEMHHVGVACLSYLVLPCIAMSTERKITCPHSSGRSGRGRSAPDNKDCNSVLVNGANAGTERVLLSGIVLLLHSSNLVYLIWKWWACVWTFIKDRSRTPRGHLMSGRRGVCCRDQTSTTSQPHRVGNETPIEEQCTKT
jgi:hypothetical protein